MILQSRTYTHFATLNCIFKVKLVKVSQMISRVSFELNPSNTSFTHCIVLIIYEATIFQL